MNQQLTLNQIEQLNQITDPVARRRYSILFQLPQDLQTAFESEDTTNSVWNITKEKHKLSDGEVSKVARIIGLIFLGELPIKSFIAELKNALGVDIAKAQTIAQDINQAIFQPVRESLMAVHNISENTKSQTLNTKQIPNPNIQTNYRSPQPSQSQSDNAYEAQRRREEVLNKLRSNQGDNTPTARPASYAVKRKNVIDLRRVKKKNNRYDGFFTS